MRVWAAGKMKQFAIPNEHLCNMHLILIFSATKYCISDIYSRNVEVAIPDQPSTPLRIRSQGIQDIKGKMGRNKSGACNHGRNWGRNQDRQESRLKQRSRIASESYQVQGTSFVSRWKPITATGLKHHSTVSCFLLPRSAGFENQSHSSVEWNTVFVPQTSLSCGWYSSLCPNTDLT